MRLASQGYGDPQAIRAWPERDGILALELLALEAQQVREARERRH